MAKNNKIFRFSKMRFAIMGLESLVDGTFKIKYMRNKLYEFGDLFVKHLGEFVSEERRLANANGITDEDFRKVAKTTFEILSQV